MIEIITYLIAPESGCDELSPISQLVDHVSYGLPVHGVQGLVYLVKQVEGGRVTFLIKNVNYIPV